MKQTSQNNSNQYYLESSNKEELVPDPGPMPSALAVAVIEGPQDDLVTKQKKTNKSTVFIQLFQKSLMREPSRKWNQYIFEIIG